MSIKERLDKAQSLIRAIPDFPKPGILFQDIFPIFQHPSHIQALIDGLTELIPGTVDVIVGKY